MKTEKAKPPMESRPGVISEKCLASLLLPLHQFFDERMMVQKDAVSTREDSVRAVHDKVRRGLVLTAEQERALEEIGTVLGPHLPPMEPPELGEFLLAEVEKGWEDAYEEDDPSGKNLLPRLKEALFPAVCVARVSVPLLMLVEPVLDAHFGGPDRLRIESPSVDGIRNLVGDFGGVVTRGTALRRASQRVEEVLGASYAMGLIELRRLMPQMPVGGFVFFDECSRNGTEWLPQYASELAKDLAGVVTKGGKMNPVPETTARMILAVAISRKSELTDIEKEQRRSGRSGTGGDRRRRSLQRLFGSSSMRARELAGCARLLGRAAVENEDGRAIGDAFICLEATLLEKNPTGELTHRLMEAISYRIGRSAEERSALRKEVKRLYGIRSDFTHKGHVGGDVAFSGARRRALEIAAAALRREIEELPCESESE